MSFSIFTPNTLLSAAAASAAKGQQNQAEQSDERKEKQRTVGLILFGAKATEQQKKTQDAQQGGFLA